MSAPAEPTQASSPTPTRLVAKGGRTLLWIARVAVLVWAAFWLWFNIASMIGERDGLVHHLQMAAITLALAAGAWFWPRTGGVLMIAGGLAASRAFPHNAAFLALALPATAIGVLLLLSRSMTQSSQPSA